MKKHFFILALLHFSYNLFAINAYPELIRFLQPDKKTMVSIYMRGDEKVKWAETEDGYSLVYNDEGYFVYATLDNQENMIPSSFIATNIGDRNEDVNLFLKQTRKNLHYSQRQIKTLLALWELSENQESLKYNRDVVGPKKILVILMGFKDLAFHTNRVFIQCLFNQVNYNLHGAIGSVRDYYYENSYGKLMLEADVIGPYTTDSVMSYYGNNRNGNYQAFAREACIAASSHIDYSTYDNDNDGIVDGIHILFAGFGEEAGGGADCIWAHKWQLHEPLTYNNTLISTYSCSPEYQGNTDATLTNIGIICHELGHVFGAPDYYDTDYGESGGEYPGTGKWDIMASGAWNGNGASPAHHNPYSKVYTYKWASATLLDTQSIVTLAPSISDSNSFYRLNTATENEFFLMEYRKRILFDKTIPGQGLLIYHAHPELEGYMANTINTTHPQLFYLVSATSSYQQPNAEVFSYGIINSNYCPFPGSTKRTEFTDETTPWARDWNGTPTEKPIKNIVETSHLYFTFNNASPNPIGFEAEGISEKDISLNWDPYGYYGTMILYSENNIFGVPETKNYAIGDTIIGGGIIVYKGHGTSFMHQNLDQNKTYYYKIHSIITDTSYSEGIIKSAQTLCNPISEFPYIENFSEGIIPSCWKQNTIIGNNLWAVGYSSSDGEFSSSSMLYCPPSTNQSTAVTRITLPPFNFSETKNAVIKIALSNKTTNNEQDVFSLWCKTDTNSNWMLLQRYTSNINAEIITNLPSLSNIYQIAFEAQVHSGKGISIQHVAIETFSDTTQHIIAASTDGNGIITPTGIHLISSSDNATYTILPNPGFKFDSLFIDGVYTNPTNEYTFSNITQSHTLYATFANKQSIKENIKTTTKIKLFPNPTVQHVTISIENTDMPTQCIIYDFLGKTLFERTVLPNKTVTIPTTSLRNGIYLVKFINAHFEKTEKLIIQK